MAEPKRSPLDFGFGEGSFVQRFILAEILGPPKGRSTPAVARPRPPVGDSPEGAPPGDAPGDAAGDATGPAGHAASRSRSG